MVQDTVPPPKAPDWWNVPEEREKWHLKFEEEMANEEKKFRQQQEKIQVGVIIFFIALAIFCWLQG